MRTQKLTDKQAKALEELMQEYGFTLIDIANTCGFATHASVLQKLNQITGFSRPHIQAIIDKAGKVLDKHLQQKATIELRCKELESVLNNFKKELDE